MRLEKYLKEMPQDKHFFIILYLFPLFQRHFHLNIPISWPVFL